MTETTIPEIIMCDALSPRGFRGNRPGWWYCEATGKQLNPAGCTEHNCKHFRNEENDMSTGTRTDWGAPARNIMPDAPDEVTLLAYCKQLRAEGKTAAQIGELTGIGGSTVTMRLAPSQAAKSDPLPTVAIDWTAPACDVFPDTDAPFDDQVSALEYARTVYAEDGIAPLGKLVAKHGLKAAEALIAIGIAPPADSGPGGASPKAIEESPQKSLATATPETVVPAPKASPIDPPPAPIEPAASAQVSLAVQYIIATDQVEAFGGWVLTTQ